MEWWRRIGCDVCRPFVYWTWCRKMLPRRPAWAPFPKPWQPCSWRRVSRSYRSIFERWKVLGWRHCACSYRGNFPLTFWQERNFLLWIQMDSPPSYQLHLYGWQIYWKFCSRVRTWRVVCKEGVPCFWIEDFSTFFIIYYYQYLLIARFNSYQSKNDEKNNCLS